MAKTVWITGASSGIGEALAKEYSRRGATVVLTARRAAELERVRSELAHPKRAVCAPWDVTATDAADALVEQVISRAGPIDVLINNAGIDYKDQVRHTPLGIYRRVMDVNFYGHVALTLALLPALAPGAQVVSVTSVNGLLSDKCSSAYAAAKHALHGFFDALRVEQPELTVSLVVPGYVRTPITLNSLNGAGVPFGEYSQASKRGMSPEVFARRVVSALERRRTLVVVAGPLERFAIAVHALAPRLFYRLAGRAAPEYVNAKSGSSSAPTRIAVTGPGEVAARGQPSSSDQRA